MNRFCFLILLFFFSCTHPTYRMVTAEPKQIEVLDPEQKQKFLKIQLSSLADFENLKKIFELTIEKESSLKTIKELDLNSDFFKSLKAANLLISKLLESSDLNLIKATAHYNSLIDILNALRNRFENPFGDSINITSSENTYSPEVIIPSNYKELLGQLNRKNQLNDDIFTTELKRPLFKNLDDQICDYDKPKDGWGFKPGLKVKCNREKYKIKFGNETLSGPFNSRIFRSLGYLTPKIDPIKKFKMKYNRKYFTEFNSKKGSDLKIDVKVFGAKITSQPLRREQNPFSYLESITLNDDSTVSGSENIKQKLVVQGNFDESFEKNIKYMTFIQGTITEPLEEIEVGPWSFEEPNHKINPQVREGIILSAWVGNSDIHANNNRLIIKKEPKDTEVSNWKIFPVFIDVGYGLGSTSSILKQSSSNINLFEWKITSEKINNNSNESAFSNYDETIVFSGFVSQKFNSLLKNLKYVDVINALNSMCTLSKEQINSTFKEAGLTDDDSVLMTRKLLNRRSQMIIHFHASDTFRDCLTPIEKK